MKTFLLSLLLAVAAFDVHAQPVTASTDLLELPPSLPFETSPWATVVFTNHTDNAIDVYGLAANGPFGFDWECSGGTYVELPPRGTCVLSVRFQGDEDQPLGLIDGLVGFRLSTGTVLVDLRAFTYAPMAPFGVRNLRSSLIPLGFDPELVQTLDTRLFGVETLLEDGSSANDRRACGELQFFEQRVMQEAARERVRDWSAAVLVVQKDAIWLDLDCGGPWRNQ